MPHVLPFNNPGIRATNNGQQLTMYDIGIRPARQPGCLARKCAKPQQEAGEEDRGGSHIPSTGQPHRLAVEATIQFPGALVTPARIPAATRKASVPAQHP